MSYQIFLVIDVLKLLKLLCLHYISYHFNRQVSHKVVRSLAILIPWSGIHADNGDAIRFWL